MRQKIYILSKRKLYLFFTTHKFVSSIELEYIDGSKQENCATINTSCNSFSFLCILHNHLSLNFDA